MSALDKINTALSKSVEALTRKRDGIREELEFFKGLQSPACQERIIKLENKLTEAEDQLEAETIKCAELFSNERVAKTNKRLFSAQQKHKVAHDEHKEAFGFSEAYESLNRDQKRSMDHAMVEGLISSLIVETTDEKGVFLSKGIDCHPDQTFKFVTVKNKAGKKKVTFEVIDVK
jgi:hypothetical protein